MKIRRYTANNMQEAILKVKMDLGNEALILSTRKVRKKGLLKLFSKPIVEVLAAIDNYPAKQQSQIKKSTPERKVEENLHNETNSLKQKEEKIDTLENKVKGVETLLQKMYIQLQEIGEKKQKESVQKVGDYTNNEESNKKSGITEIMIKNLIGKDVEEQLAKQIAGLVKERIGNEPDINQYVLETHKIVTEVLGKPETIKIKDDGTPTVVMFVGPTGVGKTTTLAKIAAEYTLNYGKKVGLITADTYRIAAVEQLKTYAEILDVPLSVVYSSEEIKNAIHLNSDKDIILIDTAGRSHRNKKQIEELKTLVELCEADEIFLVLSTTFNMVTTKEILKKYNFLNDFKLIFTKIDEAPVIGTILNIKHITGKKLSYITTGQNVPDDIEVADVNKLAKKLLGRMA